MTQIPKITMLLAAVIGPKSTEKVLESLTSDNSVEEFERDLKEAFMPESQHQKEPQICIGVGQRGICTGVWPDVFYNGTCTAHIKCEKDCGCFTKEETK